MDAFHGVPEGVPVDAAAQEPEDEKANGEPDEGLDVPLHEARAWQRFSSEGRIIGVDP